MRYEKQTYQSAAWREISPGEALEAMQLVHRQSCHRGASGELWSDQDAENWLGWVLPPGRTVRRDLIAYRCVA